ncbi:MAG: polymerase protein [Candidatus Uhrbacteria bacterium GW2011_GWD2_41_121]|uniref:DNA polymerase I n=1 Tax=Candidatus Uhrbacteria bacterium GW2011_GWC1_41_20 TaxID=1618983 RepID=A0A0G0VDG5_9BACT|nr:MAG: polymerase protein [Candidatus Uhrbacteria bacterium GW2011_GWE1_39_46]KKR63820.1 MAG: polymerase protein [Candidatus Uhrbacteria bacterium GW2011_GWC2_40_450]KKR89949.1 MAG: polymerase protein [Candidatus Uhrbacteria bacterium GW2011_GWD2_41_121]KKR95823.1 MAG: polymerase protein [Candidatus Uhrbacteria bacterium GW2011_GWD1_41_16]KKR98933.1 MAG: polymerase protein [Candidatus Uhrbacteria bacterium GW2011_GWC1_41_20]KKS05865.1 MAG: polymerase protein [Candidatus Uhrbacteria bacterium 
MGMKSQKRFLILDGNALLHRAWHAIPPLTAVDGTVVNAVYGFGNIIEKMREQFKPDYMAVAWDLKGPTFRHEAYIAYKAQREKKADELYAQIPMIQELLACYGVPSLSAKGYEADDIIATLAERYAKEGTDVIAMSGDMDLLQLVNDKIHVITFIKGISETKEYDPKAVKERYGLVPEQLVDLKALMGDPSDNIPGIAGIGKKTAVELLQAHESINGIWRALKDGQLEAKFARKLEGRQKELKDLQVLVRLVRTVKLPGFKLSDAKVSEPNVEKLIPLFEHYGFRHLLTKYSGEKQDFEQELSKDTKIKLVAVDVLDTDMLFVQAVRSLETLFGQGELEIAISDGKKIAIAKSKDDIKQAKSLIKKAKFVVGHDLKQVMHLFDEAITAPIFDTMIAAYLHASHERYFDLSSCAKRYVDIGLSETSKAKDQVEAIIKLYKKLAKLLEKDKVSKLAKEIEMPLVRILYLMEHEGIEVDKKHLDNLSILFGVELGKLEKKIYKLAGQEFNIQSPSQLADILFETLHLPTKKIKKTKTGFSTAASELEKLWETHEIIPLISQYREFAKLKSTYVDSLPRLIAKDGRVHTSFNQTVTATGRLSSSDPNLQNIPVRTELGRAIRDAFVAKHGYTLAACDYSQFELRLASVMSKDKNFVKAFQDGADIHRRTAAEILEKNEDKVTKEERRAAKAINFGILYGMGTHNLARSSGLSKEAAQVFLDRYFELHPGITNYIEETKASAHKHGYVETLFGRRRYLHDINSGIQQLRASAERMAVNMPIQGTQADLVKIAMIKVQEWMEKNDFDIKMLLQVHDELVFEIKNQDLDRVLPNIREIMEGVWKSEIPLLVDVEVGNNWGEGLKQLEK